MYRSCFTLLCIFLFSHFTTNAQLTQRIVLKEVSVDTVFPQQIKLTWEYLGIDTIITIYRCKSNCNEDGAPWPTTDTAMVRMDQNNLIWHDTLANINDNNYYAVGWGQSSRSAPQNNMVLKAKYSDDCENAVSLSWTAWVKYVNNDTDFNWAYPHDNERDTIDYYIFYREKGDGDFILIDSIKEVYTTIIYPPDIIPREIKFADDKLYEFVIQAISRSDGNSVFSNIDSSSIKNEYIPVQTSISCVNVVDDQYLDQYLEIKVEIDNFPNPFDKLYLFRSFDIQPFTLIDSIDYDATTNLYYFKDEDANPKSRLYHYGVLPYTECYSNDTSNFVTNIWLWGDRVAGEKYRDYIAFYRKGIYNEVYKLVSLVYGNERVIIDTVFTDTYYYIDVLGFAEGSTMVYRIISETGCVSNTITIHHEPILRFPTAFNPGDLSFENTTFHPLFQFLPDENNYLFVIYNRWGQELFRTDQLPNCDNYKECRWDGTFQGKECPQGIYAFQLSYTFNDGAGRYSKSGSFMLVR
ncbi:MAG: gliding motility-associated C-terminal domain-containing protein [Lentimicrobiaceae bacterium]|nr:gliding motility-associated C-terminal domain-containing protein [Lentimicrobiaceae bacterium]